MLYQVLHNLLYVYCVFIEKEELADFLLSNLKFFISTSRKHKGYLHARVALICLRICERSIHSEIDRSMNYEHMIRTYADCASSRSRTIRNKSLIMQSIDIMIEFFDICDSGFRNRFIFLFYYIYQISVFPYFTTFIG